jgi:hypothetical protein
MTREGGFVGDVDEQAGLVHKCEDKVLGVYEGRM